MMKRAVVWSLLVAGLALSPLVLGEEAGNKGEKVKLSGEAKGEQVTVAGMFGCTFCKLSHPDQPCKTKECCLHCIEAGDPPSVKDDKGNIYILLTSEAQVPLMTPARKELVGQKVTVKGLLVKLGGVQAIYVNSLAKAM